jgi:glycosyltransferase involved in cell wall biosynthesis
LWEGRWIDGELPPQVEKNRNTVVMTVAHGDGFMAAQRFAIRHKLPLVVFFQDWWPDMAGVPSLFRRILEKQFIDLARECSVGLCVCEGMRDALGAGDNLQVLPPISAKHEMAASVPHQLDCATSPFRILYFGNLDFYGEMLLEALRAFKDHPHIQLQVRGANPSWPEEAKKEMRDAGLWLEFAPRSELDAWLQSADAFLIPMVFEKKYYRRMETSFPSKLIEFAQFGKPLIIWGPEYCSAVQWGLKANRALCITENNPNRLRENVESMTKSQETMGNLVQGIQKAAQEELCQSYLQSRFKKVLAKQK